MGVGALTLEDRGASVQGVVDEIADGIRLVTDDREIFTEVDVLNDASITRDFAIRPVKEKRPVVGSKMKQAAR